jgi:hypothetical protein
MDGKKRIVSLSLALVAVAARRFDLQPDDLALLLDVVEAVLVIGLGAHATGAVAKARKAARLAGKLGAALVLSACATVDLRGCVLQVSKSDASRDRLVCEGHEPIKVPRLDPALRACVLAPVKTP